MRWKIHTETTPKPNRMKLVPAPRNKVCCAQEPFFPGERSFEMHRIQTPFRFAVLCALCVLASTVAYAQANSNKPPSDANIPEIVGPKVQKVLKRVALFYKEADSLRADIAMDIRVGAAGSMKELGAKHSFAMQRPNKLSIRLQSDGPGLTLVSNNDALWMHVPSMKVFIKDPAVKDFDAPPGAKAMHLVDLGLMFTESLLSADPYTALLEDTASTTYDGEETVEGIDCEKITIKDAEMGWTIWVAKGDNAFVIKVEPIVPGLVEELMRGMPPGHEATVEVAVKFTNWKLNPTIPAEEFTFAPPPDAQPFDPTATIARPEPAPAPTPETPAPK